RATRVYQVQAATRAERHDFPLHDPLHEFDESGKGRDMVAFLEGPPRQQPRNRHSLRSSSGAREAALCFRTLVLPSPAVHRHCENDLLPIACHSPKRKAAGTWWFCCLPRFRFSSKVAPRFASSSIVKSCKVFIGFLNV